LLCFHCQQAAEKAVKAVLVRFGAEPPRTHALAALMASLPERLCPPCPEDVASLTPYATTARYPGEVEPVSRAELAAAVSAATAAVAWAEEVIGGGHDTNGTADPTLRT
jgi:HEPN domain-containing protein